MNDAESWGRNMRMNSTTAFLAACLALAAYSQRDALRQRIFAESSTPVASLPVERRLSLIASLTETCAQDMPGASARTKAFCGCKIARLSTFLSPHEMTTGRFDSVRRYLDNKLPMQQAVDQCARQAMAAL